MRTASARPIGFLRALAAELRFLLARRGPAIALLAVAAFSANGLVDGHGQLNAVGFYLPGAAWRCIFAMIWAGFVWSGELPTEREYFAGAPVAAGGHELARVVAGGAFLLLLLGVMLLGEELIGTLFRPGSMGASYVAGSFTGPVTVYLLVSSIALTSAWPVAWSLGIALGLVISALRAPLASVVEPLLGDDRWGFAAALDPVVRVRQPNGSSDAFPFIGTPWRTWWPTAAIWLAGAVVVLLVVAQRRDIGRVLRSALAGVGANLTTSSTAGGAA